MASFVEGSRKSFKAGADLSSSQYLAVKLTAAGVIGIATAATDVVIGILLNKPKQNDSGDVFMRSGGVTCKAICGAAVNLNDPLTVNSSGQLITATPASAGAVPTTQLVGYAQEATTAAGQVFEFMPSLAKI